MAIPVFPCDAVKPLRHKLGLTQHELAIRLGVTSPLISMFERGERVPKGPVAILLGQLEGTANLADDQAVANRA